MAKCVFCRFLDLRVCTNEMQYKNKDLTMGLKSGLWFNSAWICKAKNDFLTKCVFKQENCSLFSSVQNSSFLQFREFM